MKFQPSQLVGQRAQDLVAQLAQFDSSRESLEFDEKIELFSPYSGDLAIDQRPTTLLDTTIGEADLPEDHPDVELPGVTLETYLGGGGQGWVYVGRVQSTNRVVAVKVIRSQHQTGQGTAAREARLCSRVRHRNILRVFQTQEAGSFWVVIMELVQGEEMQRGCVPQEQFKACFGQLADAIKNLSDHKIVHCDVKPANILLRRTNHSPVLVDFGVAQDLDDLQPLKGISGTPYYMAPEIFRNETPNPSWDAYALGITLSVLLIGKPKTYESIGDIRSAKTTGAFDRNILEALEHLDDQELRSWIQSLLSDNPDRRLKAIEDGRLWTDSLATRAQ